MTELDPQQLQLDLTLPDSSPDEDVVVELQRTRHDAEKPESQRADGPTRHLGY